VNILIKADSSFVIGTGHIMRDLVLAKQFLPDNIVFATQDLQGNINHKIKEANYKLKILKSSAFKELNKLIKKLNINMIIIDSYEIDYKFEKKLKQNNPKLKIFVFDDMYKKHYCDILLNHNINANEKRYKKLVPKNCELRCGEKYTLLRDEFKKVKIQQNHKVQTKTIFVAMGGSDHKSLSIKILKSIKKDIRVNLVTTTANKNLEKLKEYCKDKNWINLQINSKQIAKLMCESDFAIVTPSVILNEVHFLALPFIAIKTAKNQKYMYEYLKKNGYLAIKKFDKNKLKRYIKLLLGNKV